MDDAVQRIRCLGRSALRAKFDIASAYRVNDSMLLYRDGVEGPAIADCLLWCMGRHGVIGLNYLDDFLVMGEGHSHCCSRPLKISVELCRKLGFSIASHKVEGPSSLPFLGIVIDTEQGILQLPQEKLERLQTLIHQWEAKCSCIKKGLLSLIGHLSHACWNLKHLM